MYAIARKEFLNMFRSFRSIAVILLFVIVAFSMSSFVKSNPDLLFKF
ncbi:hypothetical protein ACFFK0_00985 [Paenibacillus chartarius]|uniref:ABC transporter permease n=1 Tax=Paenibacillus chartarius TaxID=747481 RepID=A0ABV6DEG5_9BACL